MKVKAYSLAYSSLAVSGAVFTIFVVAIILAQTQVVPMPAVKKIAGITWLFGIPAAMILALAGVFRDRRRGIAVVALVVSLICGLFCTLQLLV